MSVAIIKLHMILMGLIVNFIFNVKREFVFTLNWLKSINKKIV
jgi:hypothetical protein